MKTCKICKKQKSLDEFYETKRNGVPYGHHGKCKACYVKKQQENYDPIKKRDENLKRVYGIGINEYDILLEKQDHKCAICGSTDPKGRKSGRGGGVDVFYVDHCHTTGKVRGLLCNICNRSMGYLGDNTQTLQSMIKYLQTHQ
jgi:hypothetical protein